MRFCEILFFFSTLSTQLSQPSCPICKYQYKANVKAMELHFMKGSVHYQRSSASCSDEEGYTDRQTIDFPP